MDVSRIVVQSIQSMSTIAEDPSNLTTDAYPSPPRQNGEASPIGTSRNNTRKDSTSSNDNTTRNKDSESDESDNGSRKSGNRRFSNQSYEASAPPYAFANVINISNASGVQFGSNFTYVIKNSADKLQKKTKQFIKTEKILSMFTSQELVTETDIQLISTHMDETWMETARSLGYSDGQIGQFNCDYINNGLKEVIYQFLLDWIRNNAETATVAELSRALWKSGQKECVTRWSLKSNLC